MWPGSLASNWTEQASTISISSIWAAQAEAEAAVWEMGSLDPSGYTYRDRPSFRSREAKNLEHVVNE